MERARFIILYNIVAVLVFFGSMEIATRCQSWLLGNGFGLSLHEVDPSDKKIEEIYKWHPFVGFVWCPNKTFIGSHPNQKERSAIFIDQHGFPARDNELKLAKENGEIRIATIGASTTANVWLAYDQN